MTSLCSLSHGPLCPDPFLPCAGFFFFLGQLLLPGSVFGKTAVLCDVPQLFTVRALETSQLLRLSKSDFKAVMDAYKPDCAIILNRLKEVRPLWTVLYCTRARRMKDKHVHAVALLRQTYATVLSGFTARPMRAHLYCMRRSQPHVIVLHLTCSSLQASTSHDPVATRCHTVLCVRACTCSVW